MNTRADKPTVKPAEDFTRTWRYKVGLGLIIIGIGLHEAWRHNKRLGLTIEGPFALGQHLPEAASGPVASAEG
jgi:hypothetical protein